MDKCVFPSLIQIFFPNSKVYRIVHVSLFEYCEIYLNTLCVCLNYNMFCCLQILVSDANNKLNDNNHFIPL